jgi:CheY-like chemotaxis protein
LTSDVAYNGEEALIRILDKETTFSQYAIVFMDCYMPIKNGYEVFNSKSNLLI